MDIIFKPIGLLLGFFYSIFGNYAGAVFIFTLMINMILIPLKIKQQKGMASQARLKPKQDALKEKYKDDKTKYNQALQELMAREKINPLSGCLPLLIQMPFLLIVYNVVSNPLTHIANLPTDVINKAKEATFAIMTAAGDKISDFSKVTQLQVVMNLKELPAIDGFDASKLNFDLFGLNLAQKPHFSVNFLEAQPIWIIPLLSFAASLFSSLVSMKMNKKINPGQSSSMGMMLPMTLLSLVFAFNFPGAVGFYWACSSFIGGVIQAVVQYFYNPNKLLAADEVKTAIKRREFEKSKMERTLNEQLPAAETPGNQTR